MSPYTLTSIVITLAVLIAYINQRFIRMQSTIAIMSGALILSIVLLALEHTGLASTVFYAKQLIASINFPEILLKGILSFLLFAGSLTINASTLKKEKWEIGILATLSTIASMILISLIAYYLLPLLGFHMPFIYCLLFGALISPTDPIAVLATFKEIGAPKRLETCVAGESLFNDGVAIVLFLTIYQLAFNGTAPTFANVSMLFLRQAIGGIIYGVILGFLSYHMIRKSEDHRMPILITLAVVTGGYSLAEYLNISGPLAMVVAGIFVGNSTVVLSKQRIDVHHHLESFWEIIDEILNAGLFLLIGFELLNVVSDFHDIRADLLAIPLVLLVRLVTVAIPIKLIQLRRVKLPYTISILTWGGLRGGLAVALALALPHSAYRHLILSMTFSIVAFSIIVQGLTIKPLARKAREAA